MKFQSQWEEEHKKREWGKYPCDSVIRFIARNFYQVSERKSIRILDAGCGTGANAWYLIREGFDVYGFDGSESAIKKLKARITQEHLSNACLEQFVVRDAMEIDYETNFFDAVIDNSMLPYLDDASIVEVLQNYKKVLRQNTGILFCGGLHEIDGVYGLDTGTYLDIEDANKRWMIGKIQKGRLQGGYYHNFFSRQRITDLFGEPGFRDIRIDYFTESHEDKTLNYKYYNVISYV